MGNAVGVRGKAVTVEVSIHADALAVTHVVFGRLGLWGHNLDRFAAAHRAYYVDVVRQIGEAADAARPIARGHGRSVMRVQYWFNASHWAWLADVIDRILGRKPKRAKAKPKPKPRRPGGGGRNQGPGGSGGPDGLPGGTGTRPYHPVDDVFRRVYKQGQELLGVLIGGLDRVLAIMGATNDDVGRRKFGSDFRELLVRTYHGQLAVRVSGAVDVREAVVVAAVLGVGGDQFLGRQIHEQASRMTATQIRSTNTVPVFPEVPLNSWIDTLHARAVAMRGRLAALRSEINKPYDHDIGLDQACTLLSLFPDVAQPIYIGAGLQGLSSFPPQRVSALNADAERFSRVATTWFEQQARREQIVMGGIIVTAIALGIVSGGTMTPLMALIVSGGFGLGVNAANIYSTQREVRFQMDARAFHAGSDERVAYAEGEADAAIWSFVIELSMLGVLGKVGGAGKASVLRQALVVTAISGVGGALTMATNPNVWKSPNVVALIVQGTLIGGALGAGGFAVGNAVNRSASVALFREHAPLEGGKKVMVELPGRASPLEGTVIKLGRDDLWVRVGGEVKMIKVERVSTLEGKGTGGGGKRPEPGPLVAEELANLTLKMQPRVALERLRKMTLAELYSAAKVHLRTIKRLGESEHQDAMLEIARQHLSRGGTLATLDKKSRDLVMHEALEGLLYSTDYRDAHMTALRLLGHSPYDVSDVPVGTSFWEVIDYRNKKVYKKGPSGDPPEKGAVEMPRPQP